MLSQLQQLFNFSDVGGYLPTLLWGALISVELTVCVMLLSLIFGLLLALGKTGTSAPVRYLSILYIEVVRGTPCLLQLFYIYFVLPSFGIQFNPFTAGVIGLTVNYSAYLAEVYRAGIEAVPKAQIEAALALGMSRRRRLRLVILPQALRIVVPPLGNYFISLFKDTSLVSIVTVKELMFSGQIIASMNFQYFTVFTIVGALYLGLSYPGSLFVRSLERRIRTRRSPKPRPFRPSTKTVP